MASLVTRIRYRGNCPVTVHESMVTSVHRRMEPRRSLLGASVDQTEAPYMPIDNSVVENALRPDTVAGRVVCIWGASAEAGRQRHWLDPGSPAASSPQSRT